MADFDGLDGIQLFSVSFFVTLNGQAHRQQTLTFNNSNDVELRQKIILLNDVGEPIVYQVTGI